MLKLHLFFKNKVEFDTAVNAEAIKFEGSAGTDFGMLDATWLGIMNNVQISTITTMRYDLVIDGTDRLAFTRIRSFSAPEPFLALLMGVGLFGLFIRMQDAVVNSDP